MADTYTYTARSADHPERVVTLTLRGARMSVEMGAPLEQVAQAIQMGREAMHGEADQPAEGEAGSQQGAAPQLWLRPLAFSLIQRSTRPIHVNDVLAEADDDWLQIKAWMRLGGLRLAPVTLIEGRVDNPVAARDFVEEVHRRKTTAGFSVFDLPDYWATWALAGLVALGLFQGWRRRGGDETSG